MATVVRWTGLEARALREALRMSVRAFAAHARLSVSTVAAIEARGQTAALRHATQQILDRLLDGASRDAIARFEVLLAERFPAGQRPEVGMMTPQTPGGQLLPQTPELRDGFPDSVLTLMATGRRVFARTSIGARMFPAVDDGQILATITADVADQRLAGWPGHRLVVGVVERGGGVETFGMDSRRARQRPAEPDGRLPIPRAYRLDDLTVGLLWAVANFDGALLDDDARLAACQQWVSGYEMLSRSSASRDAAEELSPASQMWLGSDFCARHILRYCGILAGMPAFWTREQHGEEASSWLLFTHKYDYLRQVAARYRSSPDPLTRTFSITEPAVVGSPRPERVLLMLAGALMESFGIRVSVCTDAAYRALEGFVLDPQRRAIVANWVDADAIWHVDVSTNRSTLRGYADALDYGQAHSAVAAATPQGRLMALAGFLDLDWGWLARRCGELAAYGSAGIAEPRSRLLSTAGVDRASAYLATAAQHEG